MLDQVTRHPEAKEQLLYFISTSLTSDDQRLVFITERTGHPNVFDRDLRTGRERQLTRNGEGFLKSYVYFDGTPYQGFGKASTSFHAPSGTLYYIHGREIRLVDAAGRERTLAEYPDGQMTAFTHVSADGTRLVVPTTDERALDGRNQLAGKPRYNIDQRVREEGLSSFLRVYDTATGKLILCEEVPRCWITHVQFSPLDVNLILYNHEWPADCGIRRMWLFDGRRHLRLRIAEDGRSKDDFTCHEMWERDGSAIIYHGKYAGGASYIGRVKPDGGGLREIALKTGCDRYGHFTVGNPGILVTDGYYEEEGEKRPGAATGSAAWMSIGPAAPSGGHPCAGAVQAGRVRMRIPTRSSIMARGLSISPRTWMAPGRCIEFHAKPSFRNHKEI